ncbi:kinase-like domain-containing protein [Irpex rosettiformis]|uniref:Kinase-like domain-containing protein n=1 Tax=Irpex rosettiformis TaxID=378272 RepID=A0ACB8U6W5_9APHY|nr:kinase-like domain-containing protein [Irpex rosettiformis]
MIWNFPPEARRLFPVYRAEGEFLGRPSLFTTWVGESLVEYMKETRLSLYEVIGIAQDIMTACSYLHTFGILHNDIRPSNVCHDWNPPGHFVLIDFGRSMVLPKEEGRIELERLKEVEALVPGGVRLIGDPMYASIEALGYEVPSRRDDFVSLAYAIVHILHDSQHGPALPWIAKFWDADFVNDAVLQDLIDAKQGFIIDALPYAPSLLSSCMPVLRSPQSMSKAGKNVLPLIFAIRLPALSDLESYISRLHRSRIGVRGCRLQWRLGCVGRRGCL